MKGRSKNKETKQKNKCDWKICVSEVKSESVENGEEQRSELRLHVGRRGKIGEGRREKKNLKENIRCKSLKVSPMKPIRTTDGSGGRDTSVPRGSKVSV